MEWITENWDKILIALGGIYTAATVIATLTPTTKDDTFLAKLGRLFDRIGLQIKSPK